MTEKQNANFKGRKFIALVAGMVWGLFFVGACMNNQAMIQLSPFAIVIAGLSAAYMGSNVLKEKVKK